jgi:ribonuclease HI
MKPYLIYTDGSYYHNLDIAGYGFVIYEGEHKILNFFGENSTTEKSYNYEEYGILKALEKAKELSFKNIILLNDCKNLVEKLSIKSKNSSFEIKNAYFLDDILELFNYFDSIELQHIYRKDNLADYYSRTFIHQKSREAKQINQNKMLEQKHLYFNHPKFDFIQNKLAHHLSLDKFNSGFRSSLIGMYAYKSIGLHIKWDEKENNFFIWHYQKINSREFNITKFHKVLANNELEFFNVLNHELKHLQGNKILLSVDNLESIADLVYLKNEKPPILEQPIEQLYQTLNHIDELFFLDDYIPLFCRAKIHVNKKKVIHSLEEKIVMMEQKIKDHTEPHQKLNCMAKLITMMVRNYKDKGEDMNQKQIISLKEELYRKFSL